MGEKFLESLHRPDSKECAVTTAKVANICWVGREKIIKGRKYPKIKATVVEGGKRGGLREHRIESENEKHYQISWKAINSLIWSVVGKDDLVRIQRASRIASKAEIVSANILVEAGGRGTDKCADCIHTPYWPRATKRATPDAGTNPMVDLPAEPSNMNLIAVTLISELSLICQSIRLCFAAMSAMASAILLFSLYI